MGKSLHLSLSFAVSLKLLLLLQENKSLNMKEHPRIPLTWRKLVNRLPYKLRKSCYSYLYAMPSLEFLNSQFYFLKKFWLNVFSATEFLKKKQRGK